MSRFDDPNGDRANTWPAPFGKADLANFQVRGDRVTTVLEISGELDLANRDQLREYLGFAARSRRVIIDARGVSFMDVAALHALSGARRKVEARGGRLCLVTVGNRVSRLLRLAQLTFVTAANVEQALILLEPTDSKANIRTTCRCAAR